MSRPAAEPPRAGRAPSRDAPVDDEETRALMNVFHDELSTGLSATQALVNAQRAVPEARGFVCFGAG